jgi:hypothetical protein
LISVSIQDLRQNPQDTSNFYLANIYQATINPNAPNTSFPASPPPFSPPNYAVWVNALWFLSLTISLTCALLATFLQQWARRFLKVTHSRYSPHKRARIRAFFAEGVEKCLLPWAVETLPTLLHISLFLFFAGLVVFLWNVNLTIFKLVLSWVAVCTALYGCFTLMPFFRHDSPYYTSLSSSAWSIVYGLATFVSGLSGILLIFTCWSRESEWLMDLAERCYVLLSQGMQKAAEETALNSPSEIDTRAFMWTFDCLDEDHELERFFSGLPGLRSSKVVDDPFPRLTQEQHEKLLYALIGLWDRTVSSDLLPEAVKSRRTIICGKAVGPADISSNDIQWILSRIAFEDHQGQLQSADIARLVRSWDGGKSEETTMAIRAVVSCVVARAQRRDDLWFAMASDEMGVPESVLRNHATHGNNLSLAILMHVVRKQFSLFRELHWPWIRFSEVLEAASKFDVLDTSPELQHEFCALWNEIVQANGWFPEYILRPIRNIYLTLHLHTDSVPTAFDASTGDKDRVLALPSSYPLCNIPGHHSDSMPQINDAATPTSIADAVLRDDTQLASTPDAPTSSVPAPVHVYNNPMDLPLLESISAPLTPYPAHQISTGNLHDSTSSPDPAGPGAARDNPSAQTMAPSTCESSTPTSSVILPAAVSPHNHTELLVHPDALEILSSDPPESVLDGITGLSPLTTHLLSQSLIAQD